MKTPLTALAIGLALCCVACKGSSNKIVGKWKFKDSDIMTLEFKPDNTYVLTGSLGQMTTTMDGTYEVTDKQVTMTPTKMAMHTTDPKEQADVDSMNNQPNPMLNKALTEPITWNSDDQFTMSSTSGWMSIGGSASTFIRSK